LGDKEVVNLLGGANHLHKNFFRVLESLEERAILAAKFAIKWQYLDILF
jgi:hypothetical protein